MTDIVEFGESPKISITMSWLAEEKFSARKQGRVEGIATGFLLAILVFFSFFFLFRSLL